MPGLVADVLVIDVGDGAPAGVDDAYRATYGGAGATSVVTAAAAASTLRLDPDR